MTAITAPDELKHALSSGMLSFPLTDFDANGEFNPDGFARRLQWLGGYNAGALFAAGGAGEFFSLTGPEYAAVIHQAVTVTAGARPVIAATGYGTRMAIALAREAQEQGADGLLLLPPYLTEASQQGLRDHVIAVCQATRLGVIVYNRANMRIRAETLAQIAQACPNLIGFKDGVGDLEELLKIKALLGDQLLCINGMPTAEIYASAYCGMGVPVYSSAIFNFVPRSAVDFHKAVVAGDQVRVRQFTRDFLAPYGALRARQPGYAVSIVKAGAAIVGRSAGKVRPPLSEVTLDERAELERLIARLGPQD
ncbi:MAG: 5-dehydro-4-deoxyglucarate dehydratase [Pseudomonadota bacterium]